MAVPTVNSSNNGSEGSNTTTHTVNFPPTVNAGELLLVFMSFDGNPTVTWDNTTFGTWQNYVDTANGTACKFVIYGKVASGSEGGGTLSISSGASSEQSVHRSLAIGSWEGTLAGGVNCPTPVTGTSDIPDPPAATDSWGSVDRKTIACFGCDFSRTVSTYPTNYTLNQFSDTSAGGAGCGLGSAGKNDTATGSQNPTAFTISASDQWVAATVSVRGTAFTNFDITPQAGSLAVTGIALVVGMACKRNTGALEHISWAALFGALNPPDYRALLIP